MKLTTTGILATCGVLVATVAAFAVPVPRAGVPGPGSADPGAAGGASGPSPAGRAEERPARTTSDRARFQIESLLVDARAGHVSVARSALRHPQRQTAKDGAFARAGPDRSRRRGAGG